MDLLILRYSKARLSRLLDRVAAGEEIVLGKHGKPIAKLVPIQAMVHRPGRLKGKIKIAADFDAPLPEDVSAAFRDESEFLTPIGTSVEPART